jgi:hypothetical protein
MPVDLDETTWLQGRLERALAGRALEEVLPEPRALVGFEAVAAVGVDAALARRAAAKLQAGGRLLPAEQEVLEVGIRLARPALRIERGRLPHAPALNLKEEARTVVEAWLPGIASVGWSWDIPLATAFQVAPRVLVTNAHVAEKLLRDSEDLARGHFVARFEVDAPPQQLAIPIGEVLEIHPLEDVAFLSLERNGPLERGLRLAREPRLSRCGQVLGVGFPLYSASHPPFIDALFENVYGVKRASPGELLGLEGERLYHDCTTLQGNSGSPLFDARTGLVVGIHATGQYALRNTAINTRAIHALAHLRALVRDWE